MYEVRLTVTDSNGLSSTVAQYVSAGQPIIVNDDYATTYVDTTSQPNDVLANDNGGKDINGVPLTVTIGTDYTAAHGTVVANPDGTLTYTPDPGYAGPDYVEYVVTNGLGYTNDASLNMDVEAHGDPKIVSVTCPQPALPHKANGVCNITIHDPDQSYATDTYDLTLKPLFYGGKTVKQSVSFNGGDTKVVKLLAGNGAYLLSVLNSDGTGPTNRKITYQLAKVVHFTVKIGGWDGSSVTSVVNNYKSGVNVRLDFAVAGKNHYCTVGAEAVGKCITPIPRGRHWLKVYYKKKVVAQALRGAPIK
jgi:hypothetical protein